MFCSSGWYFTVQSEDETVYWKGPYSSEDAARICGGKTASFKRLLVNECQKQFNEVQYLVKGSRQALAAINFFGELFKVGAVSSMIMHYCITTLLYKYDRTVDPDETKVGLVCSLLMSVGRQLVSVCVGVGR